MKPFPPWSKRFFKRAVVAGLLVLVSAIPVQLAIAYHQYPQPQAILTLGGNQQREIFTAKFSQKHPSLNIWVSSGQSAIEAFQIFQEAGVPISRVRLDFQAVDTVTNFTSMVDELQNHNIHHVYLITSDFHMPRAIAIATIVFGSRGIAFTPVPYPTDTSGESFLKIVRDVIRSVIWLVSGYTGANFVPPKAT